METKHCLGWPLACYRNRVFFSHESEKRQTFKMMFTRLKKSRTEMLGTDPGSKFQGASFLFQQCLGPKIEFWGQRNIF